MSVTSTPAPIAFSELGQRAHAPTIARLMTTALANPDLLSLAAGFTDNRSLPVQFITDAAQALASSGGEPEYLQYGPNQGRIGLRRVLADRLQEQEPALLSRPDLSDEIVITNGSQQALYLAMQVLCNPGDIVLVDRPSYFVFLEMLTGLGIEARSLPVTPSGEIDHAKLKEMLEAMRASGAAKRLRAVYFVSYFSNPSARSLTEAEKNLIAAELSAQGLILPVLEDAAYRELYYERPMPARSVLSLPAWDDFPKFYLSTLTKPFATGMKVGYGVCTDPDWRSKMLHVKGHHDFGTAHFNQAVLETVLRNGNFDQHLQIMRPAYAQKCAALHAALENAGLSQRGWTWAKPAGGLYLWLRGPNDLETGLDSPFCRAALEEGVLYVPGELCFGDGPPKNFARVSFGVLSPDKLREAAARFGAVSRRFSSL